MWERAVVAADGATADEEQEDAEDLIDGMRFEAIRQKAGDGSGHCWISPRVGIALSFSRDEHECKR
jgi:hypothetical protein